MSSRILIAIEQVPAFRFVADNLADWGFGFVISDLQEIVTVMEGTAPELLLTDAPMSEAEGLSLLVQARMASPSCRVIAVGEQASKDKLLPALALGLLEALPLPLEPEQLRNAILDTLGAGEMARRGRSIELSDLKRKRESALVGLQGAISLFEQRQENLCDHSYRVACYAGSVARQMNLPEQEVKAIEVAARLHDIGMISISPSLLQKPGPLTEQELALLRRHAILGSDLLDDLKLFDLESLLVRYHHEDFGGGGYPYGLSGEAIPLGSRIIRVCDSMDAMLSSRSYRPSFSVPYMLEELSRVSGLQFDPAVAGAAARWAAGNMRELCVQGEVASAT